MKPITLSETALMPMVKFEPRQPPPKPPAPVKGDDGEGEYGATFCMKCNDIVTVKTLSAVVLTGGKVLLEVECMRCGGQFFEDDT